MNSTGLYPLKFIPILKDRLWGGSKLAEIFGKQSSGDHVGESWEISGVPGDVSVVANGPLKGKDLQELIDSFGESLLGSEIISRFGNEFPILIKFIDAAKDLSIQLHPGDELARERHNSFGKTEMWYIMDAEKDSRLIIGFKRDVSPEEYQKSLADDTLLELLHYEDVAEGDTFFINTGKVHAIGAGIMLAEIQQTSDITYRIFDFNRRDQNGQLRELHTELALEAIDYKRKDDFKVDYESHEGKSNVMVSCPYFKTSCLNLKENKTVDLSQRESFTIYMCVKGQVNVEAKNGPVSLQTGETVLIPASISKIALLTEDCRLLEVTI